MKETEGRRVAERLVALFILGCAVLNFPLLSIVRDWGSLAGIPVLYVYLFLVWALLIVATALAVRLRPPGPAGPSDAPGPREL